VRDVAGASKAAGGISARAALLKEVLQGFGVQGGTATANPMISRPFAVRQNFPNPFNPRTSISVFAPRRGNLSLKVYNVRGELIRVLYEGVVDEGVHAFIWDGRDGAGSAVASGVYLYRAEGFGSRQVHKMTLIR